MPRGDGKTNLDRYFLSLDSFLSILSFRVLLNTSGSTRRKNSPSNALISVHSTLQRFPLETASHPVEVRSKTIYVDRIWLRCKFIKIYIVNLIHSRHPLTSINESQLFLCLLPEIYFITRPIERMLFLFNWYKKD